jgi:hypothetical protein
MKSLMLPKILIFCWICVSLTSCDSQQYDAEQGKQKLKLKEDSLMQKREKRIAKGDTIALTDQQLKDFLPKKVLGYTPEGATIGTPYQASGASYSSVEQFYVNQNNHLRITIDDYNGAEAQTAKIVAMWEHLSPTRSQYKQSGLVDVKGFKAWQSILIRKGRAELMIAVSDRIMVSIQADHQQDATLIQQIAKSIDLKKLAKF